MRSDLLKSQTFAEFMNERSKNGCFIRDKMPIKYSFTTNDFDFSEVFKFEFAFTDERADRLRELVTNPQWEHSVIESVSIDEAYIHFTLRALSKGFNAKYWFDKIFTQSSPLT